MDKDYSAARALAQEVQEAERLWIPEQQVENALWPSHRRAAFSAFKYSFLFLLFPIAGSGGSAVLGCQDPSLAACPRLRAKALQDANSRVFQKGKEESSLAAADKEDTRFSGMCGHWLLLGGGCERSTTESSADKRKTTSQTFGPSSGGPRASSNLPLCWCGVCTARCVVA